MPTEVQLYSDGACSGNPGPGGWGCVLISGSHIRKMSGFDPNTTNNRMELLGVIRGLEALLRPAKVHIVTDSTYVKNAFTEGWLEGWQRNGWQTKSREPVKNQDLWQELCYLQRKHALSWEWVKGHSGHHYNEMCDALARQAIGRKQGSDERSSLQSAD
jgi:ribonuclease HI